MLLPSRVLISPGTSNRVHIPDKFVHGWWYIVRNSARQIDIPPNNKHVLLAPLAKLTYFWRLCQKYVSFLEVPEVREFC